MLLGFMGAGKSTIGPLVAERLGWRFIDVDQEIMRQEGMTIAELFRTRGEEAFRALENRLTAGLSCHARTVLAPGGGWVLRPGALDSLPDSACTVWLRVSPEEAVRRLRGTLDDRPLLAGADPLAQARELLAQREPLYARAHHIVDVDARAPEDVARQIAALIATGDHGGDEEG